MNTTFLTPIILFAASVAAMGCAYSALPTQRWWSRPLPSFPAQATAALAAMVALRGWIELLGPMHGGLAWLSTLAVPLTVLFAALFVGSTAVERPHDRRIDAGPTVTAL